MALPGFSSGEQTKKIILCYFLFLRESYLTRAKLIKTIIRYAHQLEIIFVKAYKRGMIKKDTIRKNAIFNTDISHLNLVFSNNIVSRQVYDKQDSN